MTGAPKTYFHRGGFEPLLGATIPEHFAGVAKCFSDREAVVSIPQNRRLTYAQLSNTIDNLARGPLGIVFNNGDRIGVWSTNNIEWLLLQMATASIGAILVNINPANRTRELDYALKRAEVQSLFVIPRFRTSDYVSMLLELIPELASTPSDKWRNEDFLALRTVVVYDPNGADGTERQ
jgi:fatty-acyl-CoA synthase